MKNAAFIIFFVVIAILGVVGYVQKERDCSARGGALVKGAVDYVCVAAAGAKP